MRISWPGWALALVIALFALTFGWLALERHAAFQTNGFDLGNVDQALWNTARGRFLEFSNMAPVTNRLALHVEPVLLLFVPFYWLGLGGPPLLLATQAVVVALGAWPLYLIARARLGDWAAFLIGAAYLLLPALESAVMYDFHAVTLAPTFLLFAVYFLERRRWPGFAAFALLAMACKEDMSLVVAMLGLYAILAQRRWRAGGLIFLAGSAWFWLAVFVVQPRFSPLGANVQLVRYAWLGDSPPAIAAAILTRPGPVWDHVWNRADLPGYLGGLLWPTAFISLLAPLVWLPALPSFAVNLLSDDPFTWRLEAFHYAAPIAPFVFLATVSGLERLVRWLEGLGETLNVAISRTAILLSVVCLLLSASLTYHYFRGYSPLARPFQWARTTPHHRQGAQMAQVAFQDDDAVFAPLTLNPHVSGRRYLYQSFEQLELAAPPPDWLWLDVTALPNENQIQQHIRDTLLAQYRPLRAVDGYLLLRPGPSDGGLPPDFYSFTVAGKPPDYPLRVEFEDPACGNPKVPAPDTEPCPVLQLLGFDLHFNREEEVGVTTYWLALPPLERELFPTLYLLDAAGAPQGATTDLPATLVWRPSTRWFTDEVVTVTFHTANAWHTREMDGYRLALGVSTGTDPWEVGTRLRPGRVESDFATPLPAGRTLVELARFQHLAGMPQGGPTPRRRWQPVSRQRLPATYAGQLRLLGYDPPQPVPGETGQAVQVSLVWQALADPPTEFTRFVHLVGPDGRLWGQVDSAPLDGTYPTHLWAGGEFVKETVRVPVNPARPPGAYTLHVGLYDPISGIRFSDEAGRDHVEIPLPTRFQ
ncbi:MAG: DUF2079 domain-containing protein [Anaerolineae bacterium]